MMVNPKDNRLLAAMSTDLYVALAPHFELVSLPYGHVLCVAGSPIKHVFFPVNCVISLVSLLEDGSGGEVAVIGKEGAYGLFSALKTAEAFSQAIVQWTGNAYRVPAAVVLREFQRSNAFRNMMLGYVLNQMKQMARTAVCSQRHTLEQRVCRWILMMVDQVDGEELLVTQQVIAERLGVRREGVTDVALKLQKEGLIGYTRGRIKLLSRVRMEARVCECYGSARRDNERLWRQSRCDARGPEPMEWASMPFAERRVAFMGGR